MMALIQSTGRISRTILLRTAGSSSNGKSSDLPAVPNKKENEENVMDDLTEPTNCCMSGCANCVWIEYAEKLSATLKESDANIQKVIIDKIQDPNMKAFLTMELKCRNIIK